MCTAERFLCHPESGFLYWITTMMKPLKDRLSITLDGDVLIKVREMAEEDDRSVSSCINCIVKKYFAYQKEFDALVSRSKQES